MQHGSSKILKMFAHSKTCMGMVKHIVINTMTMCTHYRDYTTLKGCMRRIWLRLQQHCSHICLGKWTFSCCFVPADAMQVLLAVKLKKNTKQMCEQSWTRPIVFNIFGNLQIQPFNIVTTSDLYYWREHFIE